MNIEEYNDRGYKVTLGYDDHAHWMYDELWYDVSFISNHRDYANQGELKDLTIEDVMEGNVPEGYQAVPVKAYIHGQVALTVNPNEGYPFTCPWDTGMLGFVLFKDGEFGEDNVGLKGFVRHWQACLNGDIYFFMIEDQTGEVVESCGGFDDFDYMKDEAQQLVDTYVQIDNEARVAKLKAQIKHRVPLEKRA